MDTSSDPVAPLESVPFGETNGDTPFNASAIVPLADSQFLICDNNIGDALLELNVDERGAKASPLVRRPLSGLAPGVVTDLEGMTLADDHGRRYLFATSSFNAKLHEATGVITVPPSGLLRIRIQPDGALRTENMPGFRDWFVAKNPRLAEASKLAPDASGLNVEGLAWDPVRHALLFGVRTPLLGGKPAIIPVRLGDLDGPWDTTNLEPLPEIGLATEDAGGEQGVRDIQYDAEHQRFLVLVGRAVSTSAAPFALYAWDGSPGGLMRRFAALTFTPAMKPEGVTAGTIGGRRALVFADDAGGYQVVWEGDPRLG